MRLLILILIITVFVEGYIVSELNMTAKGGYERNLEVIEVEATAYSPSRAQTDSNPFETASGKIVKPSELEQLMFVAASRDLIKKYGLKWGDTIYIGFKLEDTMNKRIENTIDVFFRNQDLAKKFGRQE